MRKRPLRVGIICSVAATQWVSCEIITANLEKSYRKLFGRRVKFFSGENWKKPSDIRKVAERIHRYNPDRLVFLDHTPHPGVLLRPLKALYPSGKLPPVTIHVFGDFTRYTREWLGIEDILRGTRVSFVCASDRQRELISRFLQTPLGAVCSPFPVDSRKYSSDEAERKRWRQRLGIRDDDLLAVYTGRVSLQKNAIRLAKELLHFGKRSGRRVHFVVAGSFDDLGAPFFGINPKNGTSRREWRRFLKSLRPQERRLIRHLGSLGPKELRGLYNAADVFGSLGHYHDEDFGMSPAEALCCGTPCVLTSWGGYASFLSKACRLVPVKLSSKGLSLSSADIQKTLSAQFSLDRSEKARQRRSRASLNQFSIDAVSKKLRLLHRSPPPLFQGFSETLRLHAQRLDHPPVFKEGPKKGGFYERVYGAYLGLRERPGAR